MISPLSPPPAAPSLNGWKASRCQGWRRCAALEPFGELICKDEDERDMARITLRQLLDHAAEHDYGLPAFNINNMEQGLAIMEAAEQVNAPVIIQASRGARSYANDIVLARLIDALVELYPAFPVCLLQDHVNGPVTCAT